MASVYEQFEALIDDALDNGISDAGKLVLVGRISESVIRDDLTHAQGEELRSRLGDIEGLQQALNFALIGFPD
jgi:hypothetical protein